MKDIIEKENTNKAANVFIPPSVLEKLYNLQALSYAAFWVLSRKV